MKSVKPRFKPVCANCKYSDYIVNNYATCTHPDPSIHAKSRDLQMKYDDSCEKWVTYIKTPMKW